MRAGDFKRGDRPLARLRLWLAVFFIALALPSAALVYKAYDQLKWESFRQQQIAAEELAARVDQRLGEIARAEDARPVADFGFLAGDSVDAGRRRSPLAQFPVQAGPPGLVGWFQVAEDGRFTTPLVPEGATPASSEVGAGELAERQALAARIEGVLIGNRLVERGLTLDEGHPQEPVAPAPAASSEPSLARASRGAIPRERLSQEAFGKLSAAPPAPRTQAKAEVEDAQSVPTATVQGLGRVDELALDSALAKRAAPAPAASPAIPQGAATGERKLAESAAEAPRRAVSATAPEKADLVADPAKDAGTPSAVRLFVNTVEPFALGLLGSGHLVLFRAVRQGGERIIQGLLIEQAPFLDGVMAEPFRATQLARNTDLIVAFREEVLTAFRARAGRGYVSSVRELTGALLYRTRMREPFGGLTLIFSVGQLPVPPGAAVIGWVAGLLALVLVAGTWLMYRLGLQQIGLVRQQQAFVSAVSHELKTPLTSIRLYAELLRAGFADEDRRQVYYRYIQEESERLSRLIANVLTLSRIGRGQLRVSIQAMDLNALMDLVRERVASQVERAGFRLVLDCTALGPVQADPDAFVQILINLVDNALKFAAQAEQKTIAIRCERPREGWVRIAVRDYGPGVPQASRRQVFRLFYRGEDVASRAIPGTGIGLALVERLAQAMGGRVAVVNREPGAEFQVELPSAARNPG
ncbi:MAG TPA: HAMP domain-containing sensor histidine kinase [Lamprocystis sp. (in: g-proteobacteria)]|nr:HAMP domain-containing sensor histidine kinase [Lamprocystis sp. (in: g-proteobacteria)]